MEYVGAVYRPPSEAYSLLIQTTLGCSHNTCAFCSMYKDKPFRIRKMDDIKKDLQEMSASYKDRVKRIFLCDGNAFVMKADELLEILKNCYELFPHLERVTAYALPGDILRKSDEELKALYEAGIKLLYLGLESGSDIVLQKVEKSATRQQMIDAAKKLKPSGIRLSVMAITGLGGQEYFLEHANQTASALNEMQPDYVGLLALMVDEGTKLYEDVQAGKFQLLTPKQVVEEMLIIIEKLVLENCFFSSVHASNYINLRGNYPQDKERLIQETKKYLENEAFRSEFYRRF